MLRIISFNANNQMANITINITRMVCNSGASIMAIQEHGITYQGCKYSLQKHLKKAGYEALIHKKGLLIYDFDLLGAHLMNEGELMEGRLIWSVFQFTEHNTVIIISIYGVAYSGTNATDATSESFKLRKNLLQSTRKKIEQPKRSFGRCKIILMGDLQDTVGTKDGWGTLKWTGAKT